MPPPSGDVIWKQKQLDVVVVDFDVDFDIDVDVFVVVVVVNDDVDRLLKQINFFSMYFGTLLNRKSALFFVVVCVIFGVVNIFLQAMGQSHKTFRCLIRRLAPLTWLSKAPK